jgi:hypothetical protein
MPRYCHNPPSARRQMPQFAFKPTFEPLMLRHRAARRPKSPANTSKKCDPRDPGALRVGFSLILGLERVMNFFTNKAVLCIEYQALSLGWHIKHEALEPITQAMSAMRNGRFALRI